MAQKIEVEFELKYKEAVKNLVVSCNKLSLVGMQ